MEIIVIYLRRVRRPFTLFIFGIMKAEYFSKLEENAKMVFFYNKIFVKIFISITILLLIPLEIDLHYA